MLVLARFTRLGVIEQFHTDHIRTFASQGVPRYRLVGKHVGRNILPSIVNIIGLEIGALLTGVIFVETVFNWPGSARNSQRREQQGLPTDPGRRRARGRLLPLRQPHDGPHRRALNPRLRTS